MAINGTAWGDIITPWTWWKHSTNGADSINGNDGWDFLAGGDGDDTINGGSGNDSLFGDDGADSLVGGSGSDALWGGSGKDVLLGGTGHDLLDGGSGNDSLNGGRGNDLLNGGTGKDTLTGGSGDDVFTFNTGFGRDNVDTITDFKTGHDKIVINPWIVFGSGLFGELQEDQFHAAPGATGGADKEDRIVYDSLSGKLFYDVDGSGGKAAVHFATLSDHAEIHADDFLIV